MPSIDSALPEGAWYRNLVERCPVGILVEQDGKIVYVNEHGAHVLGREPQSLLGLSTSALLVPQDRDRNGCAGKALLAGTESSTTTNEYRVSRPDGRLVCVAASGSQIDLHGRPAALVVLHDVTARHETEMAYRANEARISLMVNALHEGVLVFDAVGNVQDANPAAEKLLGRSLAEMRTTNLADWTPIDADEQPWPTSELPLVHALSTGEAVRNVLLGDVSPQGKTVWLNVNVEPVRDPASDAVTGAVVSFSDYTERHRVEETPVRSEETTRSLMNSLSDGVFVAQHHRFVYANPALPAMLGYTAEEFIGIPFERVISPQDLPIWTDRFRRRVGTGDQPAQTYEVRFLRKTGELIELELHTNRMRYQDAAAVLGVVRDITERKRVASELERHRDHLEERVQERTSELQRAVAARLATETFAQTVTDNIPGRVAYWDRDLRCRFVNQMYCDWAGKAREVLLGSTLEEHHGPVHCAKLEPRMRSALAGLPQRFETDSVGPHGDAASWLTHYIPTAGAKTCGASS